MKTTDAGKLNDAVAKVVTPELAGTCSVGLGLVVPGLPRPNDGVVAAAETRLPGAADFIALLLSAVSPAPILCRDEPDSNPGHSPNAFDALSDLRTDTTWCANAHTLGAPGRTLQLGISP